MRQVADFGLASRRSVVHGSVVGSGCGASSSLASFALEFAPKSLRDFGGIDVIDGLDFQSRWEVRQTNRP